MSTLVLDASVAIKLISREPDSGIALRRVAEASEIIAPDWMMLEAAHGLWKKVQMSSFDRAVAKTGLDALAKFVDRTIPATTLMQASLKLRSTCRILSMIVCIWRWRWKNAASCSPQTENLPSQ